MSTSFGFGSTAATPSSAGTLFGAAPATGNSGSLFGANNTNNSSAGALFGSNTANSSAAGTLFGGSAAPASTGFGGFGSTATSAPATSAAPTGGFGGFGSTSQPATGFGGFGATSQPAAPAASSAFGGFGATSQPAAANTTTTGFGGFGATAQPTNNTTGFGGFGTAANTTNAFGSTTATSTAGGFGGFGAAKPAFGSLNNTTNLFGNKPQQQQTGFGVQPQGFGAQQQQQQGAPPPVQEKVWQDLALIRAHFDPTSPLCQFRHYFYNMVPANEIHLYVRPQNQDEQLWNEAQRKNPDPTNLVPVLAVGFDDILKRMEIQSKQLEIHQEKLRETAERLTSVQRQYELGTLVKIEEHKRRHTEFTQRLLRLLRYSQVLRYKNFPLSADEENTMQKLAQLSTQSDKPEVLREKLIQLWNQLQSIKAQKMMDENGKKEVWRTVNEEDTNMIAKILEDEQKGIKHIASILRADAKEMELVEKGLREKHKLNDSYVTRRQT